MKTISINELQEFLKYSDLRAVRKWCIKNGVLVIKTGKNEFVVASNFNEAYELPFINKLKSKFGEEWEQVYHLYKDNNVPALNMLNKNIVAEPLSSRQKKVTKNTFADKFDNYVKTKAA